MGSLEILIRKAFSLKEDFILHADMGPGDIPGWNSLGMIELFAEIERIYKTSIPLGDMADIESISDLHSILERNGLELER